MKANQKGFSVVEILIVIVVVGLLGAVGWLVYDRQKSPKQSATSQNTSEQTDKIQATTNPSTDKETIKTTTITNKKFSVSIPSDWNHRTCMDHDGLGALVAGGDGEMRCIWDDATWLGTDMASRGKIAMGYSSSPYPRQDFSSGQQKDVYESDAKDLKLSDGRTVKKYSYVSEETNNKGKTFKVVEYTVDGKVTVFVFDGHTSESTYVNKLSSEAVIKLVEDTVLPSVKLL